MSKLPITALSAAVALAAAVAFSYAPPADATADPARINVSTASAPQAGYRTCFMQRRLVFTDDTPRMELARRCTIAQ